MYIFKTSSVKIRRINFPPLPFDCRYMYHQVLEFQIIVGPTPSVIRVIILKEASIQKAQFTAITPRRKLSQTQHEDDQLGSALAEASDKQSDEDKECQDKLFSYSTARNYGTICREFASVDSRF